MTTGLGFKIKHLDNEITIKIAKLQEKDIEEQKAKQLTSWKSFISENLKGKKLGNLQSVNDKIKELAIEWKRMKENNTQTI